MQEIHPTIVAGLNVIMDSAFKGVNAQMQIDCAGRTIRLIAVREDQAIIEDGYVKVFVPEIVGKVLEVQ
jgi:hypothetical protein